MAYHPLFNAQDPSPYAGLWVGGATLNKVSQPTSAVNFNTPVGTASDFNFRLLVHVNAGGQARLLQKVTQMWKPGAYTPATNTPGWNEVGQSGDYVLITDDRYLSGYGYGGASQRDGRSVGRRFSSAAFGFPDPIPMSGAAEFTNGTLSRTVFMAYTNRLNPFVHRYHPNHDNLDARFSTNTLPAGVESFDITRLITLTFAPTNPVGFNDGWGDTRPVESTPRLSAASITTTCASRALSSFIVRATSMRSTMVAEHFPGAVSWTRHHALLITGQVPSDVGQESAI